MIPWDDDIDLCVLDTDEEKLLSLFPKVSAHGLVLRESYYGYRVWHISESRLAERLTEEIRYPCCDIFIMRRNPENSSRIEFRSSVCRIKWPHEWYSFGEVEPRQLRTFGNFQFMCAHKQNDFLERAYGKDYMKVGATQDIDHIRGLPCTPVHFKLDKYLYEPAKPFV